MAIGCWPYRHSHQGAGGAMGPAGCAKVGLKFEVGLGVGTETPSTGPPPRAEHHCARISANAPTAIQGCVCVAWHTPRPSPCVALYICQ